MKYKIYKTCNGLLTKLVARSLYRHNHVLLRMGGAFQMDYFTLDNIGHEIIDL